MRKTASVTEVTVSGEEKYGPKEGLHRRLIDAAQKAVRAALREHKLMGNSIAVWRNGRVVLLPPEQIDA
jgi:hypothetical protein